MLHALFQSPSYDIDRYFQLTWPVAGAELKTRGGYFANTFGLAMLDDCCCLQRCFKLERQRKQWQKIMRNFELKWLVMRKSWSDSPHLNNKVKLTGKMSHNGWGRIAIDTENVSILEKFCSSKAGWVDWWWWVCCHWTIQFKYQTFDG